MFLGSSLTDQEIAAVKSATHDKWLVAAKGFDADKLPLLLASFEVETQKGKVKPNVGELIQKMTLLVKAVEFEKGTGAFPENLKELYALGANVRGLLDAGVVTHTQEAALQAVKAGKVDSVIFIDCVPGDFGLTDDALKMVKHKVLVASNMPETVFDLALPMTAWAERVGTYTGAFSGAKLALRMGPVPSPHAKSLRWIMASALRKLGREIASSEMAV